MQRVRVGLTGLAVVVILIALATALFNGLERQAGNNNNTAAVAADENAKSGDEPLADLGMAPGAPENEAQVTPPPILPPAAPAQ